LEDFKGIMEEERKMRESRSYDEKLIES